MAYGRPANVRSHRRGNRRMQQRRAAPWISVTLVVALVLAVLGFGYQQLLAQTCSGEHTARVLAPGATATLLDRVATEWSQREPATADGTCARVHVQSRDSAATATDFATGWDPDRQDPPDVWIPASTVWADQAAASPLAANLIPADAPSIARSPAVLAIAEPAAELLDDDPTLAWEDLLPMLEDAQGWAAFDGPDWGPVRFGMANPARDTAALLATTAVVDPYGADDPDPELLLALHDLVDEAFYHDTTEQLFTAVRATQDELDELDQDDAHTALLRHISVFPALERDVRAYNADNPTTALRAVQPGGVAVEADHPYLVLDAGWVDDPSREIADMFLEHLLSEPVQQRLRDAGFHGADRAPPDASADPEQVEATDVGPLAAAASTPFAADTVTMIIDRWTALTRPANVLFVLDASARMGQPNPHSGQRRIDEARDATIDTLALFTDDDHVGLWAFASDLDDGQDHLSLVPLGALDDVMEDNRLRREHLTGTVEGLEPGGDSGLYGTVRAAYDTMRDNFDEDATNLVVIVTAGVDDAVADGPDLSELTDHLRQSPPPGDHTLAVVTIAVGDEADLGALGDIAEATGGMTYQAPDSYQLSDLLRSAVFGGG